MHTDLDMLIHALITVCQKRITGGAHYKCKITLDDFPLE